jgi:hypothetical protein
MRSLLVFPFRKFGFHEESLSLAEKIGSLRRNVAWRQTVGRNFWETTESI